MKRILLISACFISSFGLKAQRALLPTQIPLVNAIYPSEFSAMAWKGDTLFLFAQRNISSFFYVTKYELKNALKNNSALKLDSVPVFGMAKISDSVKTCVDANGKTRKLFDGIEACTIIGNTFYISAEGQGGFCYILTGTIGNSGVQINTKFLSLPKPERFAWCSNNDGYESLVQLKNGNVMALFERSAAGDKGSTYMIDQGLDTVMPKPDVIYDYAKKRDDKQRIAELCRIDDSTYYGIDFLFRNDFMDTLEYCYTKLVKLKQSGGSIAITEEAYLFYGNDLCNGRKRGINCINFEGMVRFEDGLLLISDDDPSDDHCSHLYYYNLK